jgi:hypothetical protein
MVNLLLSIGSECSLSCFSTFKYINQLYELAFALCE